MATANINIRTDKEVKEAAEKLFAELGLNMTTAINMFLRQSIRENGLPFAAKRSVKKPLSMEEMTEEQFNAEMEKAWADAEEGRVRPAEEVFADLRRQFGI